MCLLPLARDEKPKCCLDKVADIHKEQLGTVGLCCVLKYWTSTVCEKVFLSFDRGDEMK
jgi:hypothetical protein